MTGSPRPLSQAPAWQFLAACAATTAVLALLASFVVPANAPAPVRSHAKFSVSNLRAATPHASPVEEKKTEAPAPVPPPVASKPAPNQAVMRPEPAPATKAAAEDPIRAVPPNETLASSPAPAGGGSQYGTTISGEVVVQGLKVPVPDGQWRVAADIQTGAGNDVALVRETGKLIAAVVLVSYNTAGNGLGYTANEVCSRRGMRGLTEKNEDFGAQSCWSTAMVRAKSTVEIISKSAIGRAARGDLEARGMTFTSEAMIDTWFVLANQNRRVVVAVYHNPEAEGFEPIKLERFEDSAWHPKNLGQNPEQAKYLRERLLWASQTYQKLKQSFNAIP